MKNTREESPNYKEAMPRTYTGREIIKALRTLGFAVHRQKGSHVILKGNGRSVVVPDHGRKAVKPGTLGSILRQAGITLGDLEEA